MAEKTDFVLKENKGFIFKNTKKTEDKHPDYNGTINVEGKEYNVGLWVKTGQSGKSHFSVGISKPTPKDESADDLPF